MIGLALGCLEVVSCLTMLDDLLNWKIEDFVSGLFNIASAKDNSKCVGISSLFIFAIFLITLFSSLYLCFVISHLGDSGMTK